MAVALRVRADVTTETACGVLRVCGMGGLSEGRQVEQGCIEEQTWKTQNDVVLNYCCVERPILWLTKGTRNISLWTVSWCYESE